MRERERQKIQTQKVREKGRKRDERKMRERKRIVSMKRIYSFGGV